MKNRILLLLVFTVCSCNFSDETRKLSGGWIFADEGHSHRVIDGGREYVPCEVIAYGYNDNFIVASQIPAKECFLGQDTFVYKYGINQTYYWLIVHSKKLFLVPMTKSEFEEAAIHIRYRQI